MGAQVLDITLRYRADFVIAHLFGRSPSVSIKEFKRVGFPLSKVVPVGTLAIGVAGAKNAALLAASIIGLHDAKVRTAVEKFRRGQTKDVLGQKLP